MDIAIKTDENNFEELINFAQIILELNVEEIKNKFSGYTIYIQTFIEKEKNEEIMEIMLENRVSLLCYFINGKTTCNKIHLLQDKSININLYLNYLNDKYDYDFLRSGWLLKNCHIALRKNKDKYYFKLFKYNGLG